MFFDVLSDAFAKAKSELGKSVDDVLVGAAASLATTQGASSWEAGPSIQQPGGPGPTPAQAPAAPAPVTSDSIPVQASQGGAERDGGGEGSSGAAHGTQVAAPEGGSSTGGSAPEPGAAAPPKVVRKVVKKVVRRVIKNPDGTTRPAPDRPATPAQTTDVAVDPAPGPTQPAEVPAEDGDSLRDGDGAGGQGTAAVGAAPGQEAESQAENGHEPAGHGVALGPLPLGPEEDDGGMDGQAGGTTATHQQPAHPKQEHGWVDDAEPEAASTPADAGLAGAHAEDGDVGQQTDDPPGQPAGLPLLLPDPELLTQPELVALCRRLAAAVATNQERADGAAAALAQLQGVVANLTERNEKLALRSAAISEQDWEEMRREFETRLAAAERKVYALTKERDALRRGNEKLSDYGALIKEKDAIIKQVMDEGAALSVKQAEMEAAARKLRATIRELQDEKEKLSTKLADEQAVSEGLRRAKAKVERDAAAAAEAAAAELEAHKAQSNALLVKARADQAEAEERAREAASAGLLRRVREAEARSEALSDSVAELREALDRQRQAADLREEMMKQDLADLSRRCQAAEARHAELAAKLPDTTRPLLRQMEAMQAAAAAEAAACAQLEASLLARCQDAEARAAAAAERERHASERAQALQARVAGLDAALGVARGEVKALSEQLEAGKAAAAAAADKLAAAREAAALEAEHARLARQQLAQAEDRAQQAVAGEQQARAAAEAQAAAVRRELEGRVAELEAQLASQGSSAARRGGATAEPPAMAAPGYRWVLQKEGGDAPPSQGHNPGPGAPPAAPDRPSVGGSSSGDAGGPLDFMSTLPRGAGQSGSGSGGGSGGPPLAAEHEWMRATLRIRTSEVQSLAAQVRELEVTRDRLSEELVAAAQKAEEAAAFAATQEALRRELDDLRARYVAAVELLGERDEALEELRADLRDVKCLYRDQIEALVEQLNELQGGGAKRGDGAEQEQRGASACG